MKKIIVLLVIGFSLYGFFEKNPNFLQSHAQKSTIGEDQITRAFENRQSDVQVGGSGTVVKILPDDTRGSQHQKFILRLSSGQTLLIAHNIDLAPRISRLREGDIVEFFGEYEWNSRGGVVHWTHHDPGGQHEEGWLRHDGATYQ